MKQSSDIPLSSPVEITRQQDGLDLDEAVAEYTDPERWAEIERLVNAGHDARSRVTFLGDRIPPERNRCSKLIADAEVELIKLLNQEKLYLVVWRDAYDCPVVIRPDSLELWRFEIRSPWLGSGVYIENEQVPKAKFYPSDALPEFGSQTPTSDPDSPQRRRGGRPREYDWDEFDREIVRIANSPDGLPDTQAEVVRNMLVWCQSEWGKEPSVSNVKGRIKRLWPK